MTRGLQPPAFASLAGTPRAPDGKLLAVAFLRKRPGASPKVLGLATDVSKYGSLDPRRAFLKEGLKVAVVTVTDLVEGKALKVRLKDYTAHCQPAADGLVAVALTDGHYPARADATAARDALAAFSQRGEGAGTEVAAEALKRFSSPRDADRVVSLQLRVDDVKEVLLDNVHALLARGEKLDNLTTEAGALGIDALKFKKTAKEIKRSFQCCKIM